MNRDRLGNLVGADAMQWAFPLNLSDQVCRRGDSRRGTMQSLFIVLDLTGCRENCPSDCGA